MATAANQAQSKAMRLEQYLREEVENGERYFKSRFIAEDLDLSSREIGAAFLKLNETSGVLDIEKWGNAGGTTWRVRPAGEE